MSTYRDNDIEIPENQGARPERYDEAAFIHLIVNYTRVKLLEKSLHNFVSTYHQARSVIQDTSRDNIWLELPKKRQNVC